MREAVNPISVWAPFGAHSMAVVQPQGRTVQLGGQVAFDEQRNIVGVGDMTAQTRQTFANIAAVLAAIGGTLDDVVSITTYVTSMDRLGDIHQVRQEMLSEPYPASTLVQIAGFVDPAILIEITAVAVIPEQRLVRPQNREDPFFSDAGDGFSL